jgi:hypothetical protein
MQQFTTIENPTFDLPDCTPGALDYTAQAHIEEMYAFAHLFRQHTPLFGLPETFALNSFYLKRNPYGKSGKRQQEKGQQLLADLVAQITNALTQAGWTQIGVSPNNGKTLIWQPPQKYNEDACTC